MSALKIPAETTPWYAYGLEVSHCLAKLRLVDRKGSNCRNIIL
jgi:hypothetical protein